MTAQERKDAWTQEEDNILAQTILQHIRNRSTQLKGFEDAAEKLGRTSAACGFRWNSDVRSRYEDAIREARQEARVVGRPKPSPKSRLSISRLLEVETVRSHPLITAIDVINQYIDQEERQFIQNRKFDELTKIIEQRDQEIESLKQQLRTAKEAEFSLTEDYKTLLQILERARALGVLKANEEDAKIAFKMDGNGNLERIG
ncbi:RsfA family transcriptional regulator [Paenibacillus cremeus]|nr:RsfA family transcriptional regulator [Paenibacillus cremeus]